jgi:hypothetical protein
MERLFGSNFWCILMPENVLSPYAKIAIAVIGKVLSLVAEVPKINNF